MIQTPHSTRFFRRVGGTDNIEGRAYKDDRLYAHTAAGMPVSGGAHLLVLEQ